MLICTILIASDCLLPVSVPAVVDSLFADFRSRPPPTVRSFPLPVRSFPPALFGGICCPDPDPEPFSPRCKFRLEPVSSSSPSPCPGPEPPTDPYRGTRPNRCFKSRSFSRSARTRFVHSFNHRCALSTVSPPHRSFSTLPVREGCSSVLGGVVEEGLKGCQRVCFRLWCRMY